MNPERLEKTRKNLARDGIADLPAWCILLLASLETFAERLEQVARRLHWFLELPFRNPRLFIGEVKGIGKSAWEGLKKLFK